MRNSHRIVGNLNDSQSSLQSVDTQEIEEDSDFSDTSSQDSTDIDESRDIHDSIDIHDTIVIHDKDIEITDYFSRSIVNVTTSVPKPDTTIVELNKRTNIENKSTKGGLLLIFLLGLLEFFSGSALSVLAPFYTTEAQKHGLSVKGSSIVFASVFLLQIICTPVFGRYISTFGSTRLLLLGSLGSGLANIGFGFVQEIPAVEWFFCTSILMRCITAVGESAMNVAVYPLARKYTSERYRTTVLSCMETSFGLGTMSGPFLGGLMYEYGGFTFPFLVCGTFLGITGISASLLILFIDGAKDAPKEDVENTEDNHADEVAEITQLRMRKILKVPSVLIPLAIVVLTGMSSQWYQPILEPFLHSTYNISGFKASMFLIIDGAVYAVISPLIGLFLDKTVNPRLFLVFGCSTTSLAFFVLGPFYLPGEPSLLQVGAGLALHGVGMAANFIGTLSILNVEMEKIGNVSLEKATAMSTCLWMTAESLGGFFGSLAGGSSYEMLGWDISCLLNASLQTIGVVLVVLYSLFAHVAGKRRKELPPESKPLINNNNKNKYNYNSV